MQPKPSRKDPISNHLIVLAAVLCLFGLILLVGIATLANHFLKSRSEIAAGSSEFDSQVSPQAGEPVPNGLAMDRVVFDEGYYIMLPEGFIQQSKDKTERGYTVYRYKSNKGYRFTFCIIPNESLDRYSSPPDRYEDALIKSVPELSEGINGEIQPKRVMADGMRSSIFYFYEKETFRGVNFTYYMVSMDEGRKLVLKMTGKYGGYHEDDENISYPDHWYSSLLSLSRIRAGKKLGGVPAS